MCEDAIACYFKNLAYIWLKSWRTRDQVKIELMKKEGTWGLIANCKDV